MKYKKLIKTTAGIVLMMVIALFSAFSALADEEETVYIEPPTEYVEPETEYVEPETEYIELEITTEAPTEAETEYVEETTEEPAEEVTEEITEYIAYNDPVEQETTEFFIPPTVAKTVSEKKYSTNYTAGIVSWACVIVGIIVIGAALISTKISGRKAMQRRI